MPTRACGCVTWSSPTTNRLLFEAGFGAYQAPFGPYESPGNTTRPLARVTEQCAAGCTANGGIPNLIYRSANWGHSWDAQYTWRGSMSYVTGAHNLKIGYGGVALVSDLENHTERSQPRVHGQQRDADLAHESLLPYTTSYRTRNMSFYGQDQWTLGRMTLQGALRFDRNWSFSPAQQIGPTNYLPTPISFPETPGVTGYMDLSPRGGVAYDLFGNGKTSVKVNFGKYLEPTSNNNNYILSNPIGRIATTTTRSWTDTNNNFVPDCNLTSPALQRRVRRDERADIRHHGPDDGGHRPEDSPWLGRSLQRLAVRRVDPAADPSACVDRSRLLPPVAEQFHGDRQPGDRCGRFHAVQHHGAFRPAAARRRQLRRERPVQRRAGQVRRRPATTSRWRAISASSIRCYNGMLLNVSARLGAAQFQGGVNTGKTVQDNCAVRAQLPELNITAAGVSPAVGVGNPYCHSDPGFITKMTALGSYTIPKIEVLISGTFRSDQGAPLSRHMECAGGARVGGARPAGRRGWQHRADQSGRARAGLGRSRQRARPALCEGAAFRPHTEHDRASTSTTSPIRPRS